MDKVSAIEEIDGKFGEGYSNSLISDEHDEYPQVTRKDMERAVFRIGLEPTPKRQLILIDIGLVEYFKAKSGR